MRFIEIVSVVMPERDWELRRSLRIELLSISDQIENLSIKYRNSGIESSVASELNSLQIKVGELMGKLMSTSVH